MEALALHDFSVPNAEDELPFTKGSTLKVLNMTGRSRISLSLPVHSEKFARLR